METTIGLEDPVAQLRRLRGTPNEEDHAWKVRRTEELKGIGLVTKGCPNP